MVIIVKNITRNIILGFVDKDDQRDKVSIIKEYEDYTFEPNADEKLNKVITSKKPYKTFFQGCRYVS